MMGPVSLDVVIARAVPLSWSKAKRARALNGELKPTGKPDLDNCIKLLCDALNGVAWQDDAQIVALSVRKRYGEQPLTTLTARVAA